MITCRYLLFCEYCSVGERNRISFHNLFDQLVAPGFPVTRQPFMAVFELAALRRPVVNEQLVLRVAAILNGQEEAHMEVTGYNVTIQAEGTLTMNLNLSQFVFKEPGDYRVQLTINGRRLASRTLKVRSIRDLAGPLAANP